MQRRPTDAVPDGADHPPSDVLAEAQRRIRDLEARITELEASRRADEVRQETEERFRLLFDATSDGVWIQTLNGVIREVNDAYCAMSGYTRAELEGMPVSRLEAIESPKEISAHIQKIVRSGGHDRFESKHRRKDGSLFDVDVTALYFEREGGRIAIFTRDISERKRLERLYTVLSQVNEAIVRTVGEQALFDKVCQIISDAGDFPLAWIGLVWGREIVPTAWYGPEASYLSEIKVEVDGELGTGPTGTCIREDRVVVNDDFQTNVSASPWREPALRHRFRASAALPLHKDGTVIGGLSLYSNRARVFDAAQVRLLESLCADLSYALSAIEHETRRSDVERALRASEARLRQLAQALPLIVYEVDEKGNVVYFNERWSEYTGSSPTELDRRIQHVHPQDRARVRKCWEEAVRTRSAYECEYRFRRHDGEYRWFLSRALPMDPAERSESGWIGIATDVHELKEAQEALREADRRKDEFLAVLSHELRNPLAPIRNSLFVLERAEPGGQQAHRAKAVIDRQVAHLTRLVDDLLEVTRITRGKIHLQRRRLELAELVRRTVEDHRTVFVANGIDLVANILVEPLWVHADETRIAQVIGNLLGNAAKFTPARGRVELTLARDADTALLGVRDDGVGMTLEVLEELFQPFVQAAQTLDRTRGGLGLGLALVKGLVELHGGTVAVRSDGPGRGSEFTVRLPVKPAPASAGKGATSPRPRTRRVLIIEDSKDAADSLQEALELSGHEVSVAYSGPEGLAKARELRPEVLLCDIGLPGMDGYEVARAFRADEALKATVLVALTGYALPEDLDRAVQAGFEQHLAKPPSLDKLEELLATLPR